MVIYGWKEQNVCSWGIDSEEIVVDATWLPVEIESDGRVRGKDMPEGEWFATFAQAKRAAIAHWKQQLTYARDAIADIRKTKKRDVHHASVGCGEVE